MKSENKNKLIFQLPIVLIYALLTVVCINHCYFWDNIQQISKEAHWFYLTDFHSFLMPTQYSGSEIVATGYHPPLMGIMTAILWKIFGCKLWVSHVFIFLWALVLIYNTWRIVNSLFGVKFAGWVFLITMLEPTLLAQFSISSPDFILFTAFIISLRAVLEKKPWLLAVGVFFLCCINMRGIFAGVILFIVHFYYTYLQVRKKLHIRSIIKIVLPYIPTFAVLVGYFTCYFITNGWFFQNSSDNVYYSLPNGINRIIRHLLEFGLRTVENGRFVVWIIGIYAGYAVLKTKTKLNAENKTILLFFLLLTGLYFLFVFISQMPFSGRYFMPQFFLLTLLSLLGINKFLSEKNKKIALVVILCFELSGHLWIYPEKIAKSWDCTLAHLPYYELRKECFYYIDQQRLDYKHVSGGFCLYGNRCFAELQHGGKIVGTDTNCEYFILSNISNVEDSFFDDLKIKTHWIPIKTFKDGMIYITIYKNILYKRTLKS
jgi:4-amino-4-deoxy-L-arabinose transferase-like glycosyltransferase